jgi:hypothetical protein
MTAFKPAKSSLELTINAKSGNQLWELHGDAGSYMGTQPHSFHKITDSAPSHIYIDIDMQVSAHSSARIAPHRL